MKRWLDSKPPTDAQIAQAVAAGYGGWALYHGSPGDGIDPAHLASDDDFRRVLAGGLATFAYVSGNDDPAELRMWSQQMGIPICCDVERFIRTDGPWLDAWLPVAGSGLYGNGPVHGHAAAFHVFAGYFGYDPGLTWPSWLAAPGTPCGWQFQGSTVMSGISVDLSNMDDEIGSTKESDKMWLMFELKPGERKAVGGLTDKTFWNATFAPDNAVAELSTYSYSYDQAGAPLGSVSQQVEGNRPNQFGPVQQTGRLGTLDPSGTPPGARTALFLNTTTPDVAGYDPNAPIVIVLHDPTV